jgi:phosphatidylglycerophosphatase A
MKNPTQTADARLAPVVPLPVKHKGWAWAVSTVCGVGQLKPAPGTWGSAVGVGLWYALARLLPEHWLMPTTLAGAAVVTAVGLPAATREAQRCGKKDPPHVVIDEVAGQLLTFAGAPLTWQTLLAGFILFRAFDVLKPPPVRHLESLPGGAGIVLDDLGAGVYALAILQILLRTGLVG